MLVGRDRERAACADAVAQRDPMLLVGDAGIGKTTLMRAVASDLRREPFEGGGLALLDYIAYLPISRALAREPPVGDRASVAAFVRDTVGDGMLILDDLQWADGETLALLPLLAGSVPLACALRRGEPRTDIVLSAARAAGFRQLELTGLDEPDAAALLRSHSPALAAEAVRTVLDRARGNPLLIAELSAGDTPEESLPLSLSARLERRSQPAREALARLALLGRPASPQLAGAGVQELLEVGLILRFDGEVEVRHALLGEAALERVPASDQRRIHREIARCLPDPGEAARHHAAGGEPDLACRQALAAADRAKRPGDRAQHLALAARCSRGPQGDRLRLRAARALIDVGDSPAACVLAGAVEATDGPDRAEAELLLGRVHWRLGRADEAEAHLAAGLALVEGTGAPVEAELVTEQAHVLVWQLDGVGSTALAERGLQLARVSEASELSARYVFASALYVAGSPACIGECRAVLEGARAEGDVALEHDAVNLLASMLQAFGEAAAALRLVEGGIARARDMRLVGAAAKLSHLRAIMLLGSDWRAGAARLAELAEDPIALGELSSQVRVTLALARAHLGHLAEAERLCDEALAAAPPGDARETGLTMRAEITWLARRPRETLATVDSCFAGQGWLVRAPELDALRGWALFDLGTGREPSVTSTPWPVMAGAVTEARALWAMASGGPREAERLFLKAAEQWHGTRLGPEVRALWGAGEAARRAGAPGRAQRHLGAAEQLAEAHGLRPLLARVRGSLRLAGVARVAPRRPDDGVLTGRERDVLALVAQGATSTEIASRLGVARSTVESQVGSAMRKLGVRSRTKAALLAINAADGGDG